jgi:orotate phosphoribosyltransferase
MSDQGFALTEDVTGRSVLLLDDTFTTGARAQSAASALQMGGATVIAIVPAARYMNPEWEPSADYLKKSKARTYAFEYCCTGGHALPPPRPLQKGLF